MIRISAAAFFLISMTATAENLVPFKFSGASRTATPFQAECKFKNLALPKDFVVYATGAHAGRTLDYQIDDSGNQATQYDIAVSSKRPRGADSRILCTLHLEHRVDQGDADFGGGGFRI